MHPDKCKYLLPHGWEGFSKSVSGTWQIPLGTLRSVEQFTSLAQFLTHTHIDNDQFSTRLTYFIASASVVQRLRVSDAATVFREFEEFMSCTHRGPHRGASQSGLLKMTSHNFQRNMLDIVGQYLTNSLQIHIEQMNYSNSTLSPASVHNGSGSVLL